MKWHAVKDKSGAYEIRCKEELFGGIVINGKNEGAGFIGNPEENRYVFKFEEGVFSKSVKVFAGGEVVTQIGIIKLGFMDNGTLESVFGNYDWKSTGSSKIWTNKEKNAVMFLDLENDSEKPVAVLSSENLGEKQKELLLLSGWYLLVVEYRAGFTNGNLAGMPVKSDEFQKTNKSRAETGDWWETIVDAVVN